jgi:hypothetical protein
MSRFNMEILYRLGKQNVRADALLRREQDLLSNAEDERLRKRLIQVLKLTTTCYEDMTEEDLEPTWVMSARTKTRTTVTYEAVTEE